MSSLMTLYGQVVGKLKTIPDPLIILMARVGLGAFFVRAGQTKVDSEFNLTDTTLYLFREEYKVPVLPPEVAAYMATATEHVLGALLVIGLASRLSAFGLLGMTLVIQFFVYPGSWPDHLLWAAVLMLILARGPGWLAADSLVCKVFCKDK
ncbi:DoxX family protein [Magnetovibrio sp. PR-2]|uniref:DoxX family protein n=1 Tax=Magnetovibrio sp. PR-2 TaxID=3120356 RepID=UPI002FCE5A62